MEERASAQLCLGRDRRRRIQGWSEPFSPGCCPPTPPLSLFYPPDQPEPPVKPPHHRLHLRAAHKALELQAGRTGRWQSPGQGEALCHHHGTSEVALHRTDTLVQAQPSCQPCQGLEQPQCLSAIPEGSTKSTRGGWGAARIINIQVQTAASSNSLPFLARLVQEWLQTPAQSPTQIPGMPPGKAAAKGRDLHLANHTSLLEPAPGTLTLCLQGHVGK